MLFLVDPIFDKYLQYMHNFFYKEAEINLGNEKRRKNSKIVFVKNFIQSYVSKDIKKYKKNVDDIRRISMAIINSSALLYTYSLKKSAVSQKKSWHKRD